MMESTKERSRPGLLLIITPLTIFTTLLLIDLMWNDPPSAGRTIFLYGMSAITFGLVIATLWPNEGWWGLRLVAFVIFFAYLAYMIDEFVFSGGPFIDPNDFDSPSPFLALAGFIVIGLRAFFYAFAPRSVSVGHEKSKQFRRKFRWMKPTMQVVKWVHIIVSAVVIIIAVVRIILSWLAS